MQPVKFDGQIITKPGVYTDIPIEMYHGNPFLLDGPSTSSSSLKQFADRPSLYWAHSVYNKDSVKREDKPHFTFGQAAHHLILGEENFTQFFTIRPERYTDDAVVELEFDGDGNITKDSRNDETGKKWSGNAKVCKSWVEEKHAKGLQVLRLEDLDAIHSIARVLEKTPEVKNGMLSGLIETSMFYKFGNIWLRSRPDVVPVHSGDYADTKFVADIDYNNTERNIYKFGYHIQAAICRMVSRQLFGEDYPFTYFLIFIEKTPPYDCYFHELDDTALDAGEALVRVCLEYMELCIKRGQWPGRDGFNPIITKIGIPPWAVTQTQNQINHIKSEINK